MCTVLQSISSAGDPSALLIELCSSRDDLAELLVEHPTVVSPPELAVNRNGKTFKNCVRSFHRATHALVEIDYFDADYRSAVSATVALRHGPSRLTTDRLIFLQTNAVVDTGDQLAKILEAIDGAEVLGYMVMTPDPGGPIGRSLIPPPAKLPGVRPDVDIVNHVRTIVPEQMWVLGRLCEVRGIPFIQQDGNLFSCAHAAAWMTHYTAVLRGLASRRSTVQFYSAAAGGILTARPTPSAGLTSWQLATVLDEFGLPVDSQTLLDLEPGGRFGAWYDRAEIWQLGDELRDFTGLPEPNPAAHHRHLDKLITAGDEARSQGDGGPRDEQGAAAQRLQDKLDAFWTREHFTRTICQYLNAGFPAIVLRDFHAIVVTGYLRRRDMAAEFSGSATEVVAFIAADDQRGPYVMEDVNELVASFRTPNADCTLLVPLPRGIWMRANDVEPLGARLFRGAVTRCSEALRTSNECVFHVDDEAVDQVRLSLAALDLVIETIDPEGRRLAIRSYVVPGTDFKWGFAKRRKDDPIAVAQVRLANLSKFVWVVEVLDRDERLEHNPSVYGEVVFDATDTDLRETNALIVHLPGAIQVKGRTGTGRWHVTGVTSLYSSGRYHGHSDWMSNAEATASRSKRSTW